MKNSHYDRIEACFMWSIIGLIASAALLVCCQAYVVVRNGGAKTTHSVEIMTKKK